MILIVGVIFLQDSISNNNDASGSQAVAKTQISEPILKEFVANYSPNVKRCTSPKDREQKCVDIKLQHDRGLMFIIKTPFVYSKINGIESKYIVYGNSKFHLDSKTEYKDGLKNGLQTRYNREGKKFATVNYQNNQKNGFETYYYPDGSIRLEVEYKNGKRNGQMRSFNPDGVLVRSGSYKDDLEEGYFKVFSTKGKLISLTMYTYGKQNNISVRYYASGNLQSVVPFTNNLANGMAITYFQNGVVRSRTPLKQGYISGTQRQYYENGAIKTKIKYNEGKIEDLIVNYTPTGEIQSTFQAYRIETGIFRHGEAIWYKNNQPYVKVVFSDDDAKQGKCLSPTPRGLSTTELEQLAKQDILPDCSKKHAPAPILE